MTPRELLDAYARASALLDLYRINEKRREGPLDQELTLTEALIRLRQALYVLARFQEIFKQLAKQRCFGTDCCPLNQPL